jgi:hypothetical protein
MPFVRTEDIDPKVRQRHISRRKQQLRESLGNPGITAEQRQRVQDEIKGLGGRKVYHASSPPRPGALSFPYRIPSEETLDKMLKGDLVEAALKAGVPPDGTKADIKERLNAAR